MRKSCRLFLLGEHRCRVQAARVVLAVLQKSVCFEEVPPDADVGECRCVPVCQPELQLGPADAQLQHEVADERLAGSSLPDRPRARCTSACSGCGATRSSSSARPGAAVAADAAAHRCVARGQTVRTPVLPDHVECGACPTERRAGRRCSRGPAGRYGARWCFTPARSASPCTLARVTWTSDCARFRRAHAQDDGGGVVAEGVVIRRQAQTCRPNLEHGLLSIRARDSPRPRGRRTPRGEAAAAARPPADGVRRWRSRPAGESWREVMSPCCDSMRAMAGRYMPTEHQETL